MVTRCLLASLVVLLACSRQDRPPPRLARSIAGHERVDTVEAQARWVDRSPLLTFRGPGFTFQYPAGARIDSGESHPSGIHGARISGPRYAMKGMWPGNVDPVARSGPAYSLVVTVHQNPHRLSLQHFVDTVVAQYNDACKPNCPIGEAASYATSFGPQPSMVVQRPCGDCWSYEVYLARRDRIVSFAFSTDDNDLLDSLTAPLYWLIIGTFHWTDIT